MDEAAEEEKSKLPCHSPLLRGLLSDGDGDGDDLLVASLVML